MTFDRFVPIFCLLVFMLAATVGTFVGGFWASLGLIGGVVLYVAQARRDKKMPHTSFAFLLLALVTLIAFAAELPFALNRTEAMHIWVKLATIFLPLLLLTSPRVQQAAASPWFFTVVGLTMGVGAVALSAELLSGGALLHLVSKPTARLTDYNRGIAHLSLLSLPVIGGLWLSGRRRAALALALVMLLPASLTESRTTKLALLLGFAVSALAWFTPVVTKYLLSAIAVAMLGFPFYAQYAVSHAFAVVERLPDSWRHRVEIWDYLSYRIAENPWFGWGLGSTHWLDFSQPHGELYRFAVDHAPHAHNFVTQSWVETGLPGLAAALAFMLLTLRAASALPRGLNAFALGCWAAALVVCSCGFDFWTDALWATLALTAFAFGLGSQTLKSREHGTNA